MKKNPRIFLVGGGTGGHIFPLRNLTDELLKKDWDVQLVVAAATLDRKICTENFADVTVHFFRTDKIRRYLDIKNLFAPFKILIAIFHAHQLLKTEQPAVVFFKGGFVGFPFLAATLWHNIWKKSAKKIRIFSHESDISAGALTKLTSRFATETFSSFGTPPSPLFYSPKLKNSLPDKDLPRIVIFGGSQGAQYVNELITTHADELCKKFRVFLVTGVGKPVDFTHENFHQVELLSAAKLSQKIAEADLIISRAGANSLFEIIAAQKPSIIIPLPSAARNHQQKNADFFAQKNLCTIYPQSSHKDFVKKVETTINSKIIRDALAKSEFKNSAEKIADQIVKSI